MDYNPSSPSSVLEFAKKLKGKTLRQVYGEEIGDHGYSGKGNFGQLIEKFYFGYDPNSVAEPDFEEAGIELKTSPLKTLRNGSFRSKERLVLNIINYIDVYKEEFYTSSFYSKNAHLLLIFYQHSKDINLLDYIIALVDEWKYPPQDLQIIKKDWELIKNKICAGKAHELSEGDTYYLGACTKGGKGGNLRSQPFSDKLAKQRAYSLKQGYVNHIIATIAHEEEGRYGKILDHSKVLNEGGLAIEKTVLTKFEQFYNLTLDELEKRLSLQFNRKAKGYYSLLTKAILGISLEKNIEEFEKANIQLKTVRLNTNGQPYEHISFPAFKYMDLIETDWEDSDFKNILEQKFFFVFFQISPSGLILKKAKFWNMPFKDLMEAKEVYEKTANLIRKGNIVQNILKARRFTYFPESNANPVAHVRPHARNSADTNPLPVQDQLTGAREYTKHSFWLNAGYVRSVVFKGAQSET